jgi:hypothetical protein
MVHTKDSKRAKRFQKQSKLFRKRAREASKQACSDNKAGFKSLLNWLLEIHIFAEDKFHGNAEWDATEVATQALIWALLETRNVTAAFDQACKHCDELELKKGQKTYQAFMNTLTHYKNTFADRLRAQFQKKAEEVGGQFWRDESWVLLGFDGSRVTTPRTASNEAAFCAPNYGQGKTAKYRKKKSKGMRRTQNERNKPQPQVPQVWITMMWHMGLRLPWTWRLGPSNSSERGHVMELLKTEKFPEDTLFCGDAGFVGYALWSEIRRAKGEFLVRVGANVNLLSQQADFKRLRDGIVLCWPKDQMKSGAQPLRLR